MLKFRALPAASLLAAFALLVTTGCAVWRVKESMALAKASEPLQASPPGANRSLLIVGDSTAVGTGASSPAASVAGLLAGAYPQLRIVNRARDGARFADLAAQLWKGDERFDTVLVLAGGNDVIRLTGEDTLRAGVQQVAQLARERSATVVLMPSGNVGNAPFFFAPMTWWMTRRSQQLHAIVREAAQASGARYVNLYQPRATDPFAQRPRELHAPDGLHPSDAGYRLWFTELQSQAALAQALAAPERASTAR